MALSRECKSGQNTQCIKPIRFVKMRIEIECGGCAHLIPDAVVVGCFYTEVVAARTDTLNICRAPFTHIDPPFIKTFQHGTKLNFLGSGEAQTGIVDFESMFARRNRDGNGTRWRGRGELLADGRRFIINQYLFDGNGRRVLIEAQRFRIDHGDTLGGGKPEPTQAVPGGRWLRVHRAIRDRKSTRLNSSHEWISYAV